ncbi:hypothetical protein XOO0833 [Xanthomonas oryzae pv. oryzae KACC 10331]|uniref:Uncharacterized protein n=1 Tax=Xanthomonas oryzae pv. oryzae (strain KACC10331 / KXO85) TaxID=291331 RepID=Q5H4N3_XANOR|nr:hypothetical protein XOO0833 [Xanthomonas oryzae pv. oryzae KACC 10331]
MAGGRQPPAGLDEYRHRGISRAVPAGVSLPPGQRLRAFGGPLLAVLGCAALFVAAGMTTKFLLSSRFVTA